ncbi:hypothetical protein [Alloalcanivorax venustensis]|uniref:hypothetical protein n=1 Tax=Alloalcanivorax venustensis TaxID=172371 RepID=UPI003C336C00
MPKVKGDPVQGGQKLGQYGAGGAGVGDSGALCEQMTRMQQSMNRMLRNGEELQEMTRQMLESMQGQQRAIQSLIERVDRASRNSDRSVERICEAAETMEQNTQAIVKATLVAAFAVADEDKFNAAAERADQEMKRWEAEKRGLKLASSKE